MSNIHLESVYVPSDEVVARVIMDELIIVPLAAGIGDMEDELYTLNETGKAIWYRLDGHLSLGQIADVLAEEYDAPRDEIECDVLGLTAELLRRRMLIEVNPV